jgi:hypothetical protein
MMRLRNTGFNIIFFCIGKALNATAKEFIPSTLEGTGKFVKYGSYCLFLVPLVLFH